MARGPEVTIEYSNQVGKVQFGSLKDLAEKHGLSSCAIYRRWHRMGRPLKIGRERAKRLFAPTLIRKQPVPRRMMTIMPDNVQMTYNQILDLDCCTISRAYLQAKGRKKNFILHRDELAVTDERLSSALRNRNEPIIPEYADPNYLPHITFGDLAHLSEEENTGAGKGEIPDEEWIRTAPLRKSNFAKIMDI